MKKEKRRFYEETFKLEVLQTYYAEGCSINSIVRRYDLGCKSVFLSWKKRFPIDSVALSLPLEVKRQYMESIEKSNLSTEDILNKRIKDLEKALAYSNLRTRSLEVLIDVAEKNEGINIRKKTGSKR